MSLCDTVPERNPRFYRFKLSALLVIVAISAIACFGLRHWLDNRPIQWVEFSSQAFDKLLGSDSPIVVFVSADWDVNSLIVQKLAFENEELETVFREREVIAFKADLTTSSVEVMNFLRRIDRNSTPTVVVYSKDSAGNPAVLDGLVSADQIIRTINTTSVAEPTNDDR